MAFRVSNRTVRKKKCDKHNETCPQFDGQEKICCTLQKPPSSLIPRYETQVHRILEFNEKPWMEPYIRLNKELRKKTMSAFEKDFYKLMNNSVFGKTMENLRERLDIKLVRIDGTENQKIRKIMAMPNFNRRVKFSDELSAIHVHKT